MDEGEERVMTDAEIIKALECFAKDKDFNCSQCVGCAFETKGLCCENCSDSIAKASLDLINRQKAEIVRLKSMNQAKLDMIHDLRTDLETANAEIERLKKEISISQHLLSDAWRNIEIKDKFCETARAEAIKEFAEKLKNKLQHRALFSVIDTINEVLREMVGKK